MAINNGIHDKFNKRKVGFSNASSYSKTFKNYVGMTPNEYRYCDRYEKFIDMDYENIIEGNIDYINQLIKIKQQYYNQHDEHIIYADSTIGSTVNPYYLVIQINTIEEIRLLFFKILHDLCITNTQH